jgi:predicted GH43/DUF377 family glycosyl hydrolase
MTTPAPLPPRVAHNQRLHDAWMKAHGNPSPFPAIEKQIELMPLNLKGVFPWGFNPSIIRFNERLLMAYRYPIHGNILNTKIAIAEIDANWNVRSNKPISVKTELACDDPRLFIFNGNLFCCWVESVSPSTALECQTVYGGIEERATEWIVNAPMNPKVIDSKSFNTMEKNWVPFPLEDSMRFIYSTSPEQVIMEFSLGRVVGKITAPGATWRWGTIKGGTTPLPYDGKLIRFFHSTLDNEMGPHRRRYYIGAILTKSESPYEITDISKKPILYGSEAMGFPPELMAKCPRYNPNRVVIPYGAIPNGDSWLVSIGINDSQCAIAKITPENLNL